MLTNGRLTSTLSSKARSLAARLKQRARNRLENPMWRLALWARVCRPYRRLRFYSFGPRAIFHRPVWLYGAQKIAVGTDVVVLRCLFSVERETWSRPGPTVWLGDRVVMRPFSTIAAAESVVFEDDVAIGSHSYITDHDHLRVGKEKFAEERAAALTPERAGNPNVVSPLEIAPVRLGRGTWVGERVAILKGCQIGRHCVIGTNSVVRDDIPDYSIAVGAPARVVGSTRPQAERPA